MYINNTTTDMLHQIFTLEKETKFCLHEADHLSHKKLADLELIQLDQTACRHLSLKTV